MKVYEWDDKYYDYGYNPTAYKVASQIATIIADNEMTEGDIEQYVALAKKMLTFALIAD